MKSIVVTLFLQMTFVSTFGMREDTLGVDAWQPTDTLMININYDNCNQKPINLRLYFDPKISCFKLETRERKFEIKPKDNLNTEERKLAENLLIKMANGNRYSKKEKKYLRMTLNDPRNILAVRFWDEITNSDKLCSSFLEIKTRLIGVENSLQKMATTRREGVPQSTSQVEIVTPNSRFKYYLDDCFSKASLNLN